MRLTELPRVDVGTIDSIAITRFRSLRAGSGSRITLGAGIQQAVLEVENRSFWLKRGIGSLQSGDLAVAN